VPYSMRRTRSGSYGRDRTFQTNSGGGGGDLRAAEQDFVVNGWRVHGEHLNSQQISCAERRRTVRGQGPGGRKGGGGLGAWSG